MVCFLLFHYEDDTFFLDQVSCIEFISIPIVNDCSGVCVVLFLVVLSFLVSIQLFVVERRKTRATHFSALIQSCKYVCNLVIIMIIVVWRPHLLLM